MSSPRRPSGWVSKSGAKRSSVKSATAPAAARAGCATATWLSSIAISPRLSNSKLSPRRCARAIWNPSIFRPRRAESSMSERANPEASMPRPGETASVGHTVIDRKPAISAEQRMQSFHARLKERGLKSTGQRDDIARVFFDHGHHISAEELYAEVKKINPHVGYATIYRTLRLLKECELLYERHFDEGQARYEAVGERHHDHFICERCGRIIEFENAAIERMQNIVARDLGVTMTRHKMELYGICADCHAQRGM